ncbi:YokU family protein [Priestia koreensis]|uniref:YokU family protein n=1 Tax=Priestia koreensis TaxID=284581 RepID=A0A0M0LIC5_9BACI|nr:YokU family protein [Priestia koreensis]KOO50809.1 hypothetical protein AMD01_03490 [Priestia koreensis]
MDCVWCEEKGAFETTTTVYWELPDGSRSIEITETPCIQCPSCGMNYQTEETIEEIENHFMMIDTKKLEKSLTFVEFLAVPTWLKKNYFNF